MALSPSRRVTDTVYVLVLFIVGSAAAFAVPPTISAQPQSQTVAVGGTATFSVTAAGPPAPSYQWLKNGANISGATSSIYSKTNVQMGDAGNYTVYVSNNHGNITSSGATLTVNVPPAITTHPQSVTVTIGGTANFNVVATGTPTPTYQWKKDGTDISGATNASYSKTNVQSADGGSYSAFISNTAGNITSTAGILTVHVAPTISTQPQNQSVVVGGTANFSVIASGNPSPIYQWRKDGNNISGATNASFSRINVQSGDAGSYTVFVSNSVGNVTSISASLIVTGGVLATPSSGAIASGGRHTVLLKSNGTVFATGVNESGQLGDGTTIARSSPVQVTGLSGVVAVAAGGAIQWRSKMMELFGVGETIAKSGRG